MNLIRPQGDYQPTFKRWYIVVASFGLLLLYSLAFFTSGELSSFVEASFETVPFAILAIFAYVGGIRSGGKIVAILWLLGVVAALAIVSLINSFFAVLVNPILRPGMQPEFIEGGPLRLLLIFLGMSLSILIGALGFIPAVRRWVSSRLPLNPDDFVHTIALVVVVTLTLMAFMPLIFLAEPPLLTLVTGFVAEDVDLVDRDRAGLLRDEIYGLIWLIPAAIFAVGYGIRRDLASSLQRLGLVKPTLKQVLGGAGLAVVLVFGVAVLDGGIGWLWGQVGWPRTDGEAFGLIIDFAFSPIGAVVLGISAGLGEELVVRGVLQPRVGILLSNLLFTALHALQYNWDGLIIVFLIGLVFGFIRKYSNTTTCAIIHGLYDFMVVMAVVLEVPGFS